MAQNRNDLILRIKELYQKGENIIQFLRREGGKNSNSIEDILISYDFQAGSYVKYAAENPSYINAYSLEIAKVLNTLGNIHTLLEAGAGEATTLGNVADKLANQPMNLMGFDISWSRVKCGIEYLKEKQIKASLFVGDLLNIPLADNSVDIVYTSHSIEPNGGKEKEALRELYRITKKYLILLEPTDEFASEEGKARMIKNGYIQNLKKHIEELNYKLTTYRPFEIASNPLNPTGLYIIDKNVTSDANEGFPFLCPVSKGPLTEYSDHLYCPESLISYPKISGIPCLCSSYGILTSKHA